MGCERRSPPPDLLCGICRCALHRRALSGAPALVGGQPVLAAYAYGFPLDRLIRFAKNGGLPRHLDGLAPEMADRLAQSGLSDYGQIVVPVPLHISKRRERDWDQAVVLARGVAERMGLPLASRGIRRIKRTPPQKQADRTERARSLVGAFRPGSAGMQIEGRRVLLIDDVVTTGATLSAARTAVESAGAVGVLAVVAARTLLEHKHGLTSAKGDLNLQGSAGILHGDGPEVSTGG